MPFVDPLARTPPIPSPPPTHPLSTLWRTLLRMHLVHIVCRTIAVLPRPCLARCVQAPSYAPLP